MQRPSVKRMPGRAPKWKDRLRAKFGCGGGQDTLGPAIYRVCRAVLPFRVGGQVGPEARLCRANEIKRMPLFMQSAHNGQMVTTQAGLDTVWHQIGA
ncbi:MAG: hypothetical protein ACJASV_002243 [Pseudorhodobacter sp.]|jgi:hypothetical protein